jgi:glycosyltransferase involved in cell wall biosynthesis
VNITIGITTFNRFKYTKSLFNSIKEICVDNQVIVVDNCSIEHGLKEYLEQQNKSGVIHQLFSRSPQERNWVNDEYIAKNIIIENAKHDVILFLQDDLQFISNKEVLEKVVEDFCSSKEMLSLEVNAVRKSTIQNKFNKNLVIKNKNYKYYRPLDNHFPTMGFFKKEIFEKFGNYPVNWPQTQEFWGRSEDWYDSNLKSKLPNLQLNNCSWVSLFAPVWNDPRGGYAFIRGDKRYGHYLDAPSSTGEYYEKISAKEYLKKQESLVPLSFVDVCKPIGWDYQIENGDQKKYPQSSVLLEGPEFNF